MHWHYHAVMTMMVMIVEIYSSISKSKKWIINESIGGYKRYLTDDVASTATYSITTTLLTNTN